MTTIQTAEPYTPEEKAARMTDRLCGCLRGNGGKAFCYPTFEYKQELFSGLRERTTPTAIIAGGCGLVSIVENLFKYGLVEENMLLLQDLFSWLCGDSSYLQRLIPRENELYDCLFSLPEVSTDKFLPQVSVVRSLFFLECVGSIKPRGLAKIVKTAEYFYKICELLSEFSRVTFVESLGREGALRPMVKDTVSFKRILCGIPRGMRLDFVKGFESQFLQTLMPNNNIFDEVANCLHRKDGERAQFVLEVYSLLDYDDCKSMQEDGLKELLDCDFDSMSSMLVSKTDANPISQVYASFQNEQRQTFWEKVKTQLLPQSQSSGEVNETAIKEAMKEAWQNSPIEKRYEVLRDAVLEVAHSYFAPAAWTVDDRQAAQALITRVAAGGTVFSPAPAESSAVVDNGAEPDQQVSPLVGSTSDH